MMMTQESKTKHQEGVPHVSCFLHIKSRRKESSPKFFIQEREDREDREEREEGGTFRKK